MSRRTRIRMGIGTLYVIAILVSLATGGFVWVAIIGALLVGLVNMQLGGWNRRRT